MNKINEIEIQKYLIALENNQEEFDEIGLGLNIGFDEKTTKEIIEKLVEEGKIEFKSFGLCSYQVRK